MCDLSEEAKEAIEIINGTIVVGNHDSITLLGVQPQNKLKDYSKTVSRLLLRSNSDLDIAISEVISEIERFEDKAKFKTMPILGRNRHQKEIISEYNKILDYIEKVTLYFQLQQAQLLKEIKILENLESIISESRVELEKCIEEGNHVLCNRSELQKKDRKKPFFSGEDSESDDWFSRLAKRIEDLSISHTVSLQNQAQIKMLYDNNLILIDKIAAAISNTFPIWRNQMAILLGIELLENRLDVQNKILKITEAHIEHTSNKVRRSKVFCKKQPMEVDSILELNKKLRNALNEMTLLEKNDGNIRKDFQKMIYCYRERG